MYLCIMYVLNTAQETIKYYEPYEMLENKIISHLFYDISCLLITQLKISNFTYYIHT